MQDHTRSVVKYYLFFPERKKKMCVRNIWVRGRKIDDLKSEEEQEEREEKKRKVKIC